MTINTAYSFTYQTIHYTCGHSVIRRMLRHQMSAPERWSYQRCCHCSEQLERRYEALAEREEVEKGLASLSREWPPVAEVAI